MERDPVCGMNVEPEKAAATVEHGGKRYYFCSVGCGKRFEEAPEKFLSAGSSAGAHQGMQVAAAAAKPAKASLPILGAAPRVKDPVCGMIVEPLKAAGKVEHGGNAYYFCSPRCKERFEKEPEKYLAAPGMGGM